MKKGHGQEIRMSRDQALKASSHSGRTSLPDPRSADIAQGHAAPYLSPAAEAQVSS